MVKISPGHQKNGITGIDENWDNWLKRRVGSSLRWDFSTSKEAHVGMKVVALTSCDSGGGVVGEVLNRPGHGDHIKDNGDDSGTQQCKGDQGHEPCQGGQEEQDQQGERVLPLLQPQAASPAAKTSLSSQMLYFFLTFCISSDFVKRICEPTILTIQEQLIAKMDMTCT